MGDFRPHRVGDFRPQGVVDFRPLLFLYQMLKSKLTNIREIDNGKIVRDYIITENIKYSSVNERYSIIMKGTLQKFELLTKTEFRVLRMLIDKAEYSTNRVELSVIEKKQICEKLNISRHWYYQIIGKLRKQGWLLKIDDYETLNPTYVWIGPMNERRNLMKKIGK